jgi:PilZ domain
MKPATDRRKHERFFTSFEIEIKDVENSFPIRGATTDVSLGGCYVATIFPLAVGSQILFTLYVAGENIKGRGSVQTCHPGVGMGIRFVDLSDSEQRLLEKYLHASVAHLAGGEQQPFLR